MRSKAILSLVAFFSAFGISVALTPQQRQELQTNSITATPYVKRSCASKSETARRISSLIRQDVANGRDRDRKLDTFRYSEMTRKNYLVKYADLVSDYAEASASINDSDLPADFKAAWREHMEAWRIQSEFLIEKSANSPKTQEFGSSERGYLGKAYYEHNLAISQTWYEVLRIAREYDADIPADAY